MDTLLDSHMGRETDYKTASKGLRFGNLLIDSLCYFLVSAGIGVLMALVLGEGSINKLENSNFLVDYLFGCIITLGYFVFFEHLFSGKTVGKFITKTRAINIDGSRMSLKTTFIRTLCRLVPFDAFSFLGEFSEGWHDKWSDTKVILDSGWNNNVL